jgi:hypothetical protein
MQVLVVFAGARVALRRVKVDIEAQELDEGTGSELSIEVQ